MHSHPRLPSAWIGCCRLGALGSWQKAYGLGPGEVELLCIPQGRWQLEWPSQLRPEGRALYARHCVPLDGGCSPRDRADSAPGQRVIPRESGELIAFPEAAGMSPSVAQPKLQSNDPIPLPLGARLSPLFSPLNGMWSHNRWRLYWHLVHPHSFHRRENCGPKGVGTWSQASRMARDHWDGFIYSAHVHRAPAQP